jgi:uncharacterized protein
MIWKEPRAMNAFSRSILFAMIGTAAPLSAQAPLPVIDMHMHARNSAITDSTGAPAPIPCMPEGCLLRPTIVESDEDVMRLALDAMERNNIVLGVVTDGNLERVDEWVAADPGRVLPGVAINHPDRFELADLRRDVEEGRFRVIGEITTQYQGFPPDDPALDPIFELAEEFDLPTLIHTEGIAGASSQFRIAHGHPELVEEVLVRHPDLRIYLENAGYPFLDEVISLMYRYPQVYADVSTITWIIPRAEFYRYLQALMGAGLGDRLMWGSDQMNWPGTIELALEAIQEAPFLSDEQKRDILYKNAARFLRLDGQPIG